MKTLLAIFLFINFAFASILDTGIVGVSNNAVTFSNGADFYSYLNKLGDENLTKAYRHASAPIDRLSNPFIAKANVKTYEEAFANLRSFYEHLYDKNSTHYAENAKKTILTEQKAIIEELLDATRKEYSDETIIALLVAYTDTQRRLDVLDLESNQMYKTAVIIVKRILKKEYSFEFDMAKLKEQKKSFLDDLNKTQNSTLQAIYNNKIIALDYQIAFINTIKRIQKTSDDNSWSDSNNSTFLIPNATIQTIDIDKNNELFDEYNHAVQVVQSAQNDALINHKIAEIIFHVYSQSSFIGGIRKLLTQTKSLWYEFQDYSLFVFNNNSIQVVEVVRFLELTVIVLLVQWLVISFLKRKINYGMGHLSIFVTKLIVICFLLYNFFIAVLGLDPTNIAMFASAFSIAIGFGMQSMIQNFISGVILVGDKTVKHGDTIVLPSGQNGTVESITYRTTTIKTADNTLIMVPNSKIFLETIENKTKLDPKIRIKANLLVEHGSNLSEIETILNQSCHKISGFASDMPTKLAIAYMIPEGIMIEFRFYIKDVKYADTPMSSRILYDALQANKELV